MSVEQIPETLSRTQIQTRPESWADVLVVGAGPTGMASSNLIEPRAYPLQWGTA